MCKMYWFIVILGMLFLLNACETIYLKDKTIKRRYSNIVLPVEYESYIYMDTFPIHFGDHEMSFLCESSYPVKTCLTTDNNLIAIANKKIGGTDDNFSMKFTLYKYNPLGDLIDTFSYDRIHFDTDDLELVEGYLINPEQDYYTTWVMDGDVTQKEIIIHNKKFEWSEKEQLDFFDTIKNKSEIIFTHGVSRMENKKVFYWQDNKWSVFCRNLNEYKIDLRSFKEPKRIENVFDYYYPANREWIHNPYENIQCMYFHKIELEVHNMYGGGGSWGGGACLQNYWRGDLYTRLSVDGDTLKFKDELLLDESWDKGYFSVGGNVLSLLRNNRRANSVYPFLYYSNLLLEYKLFTKDEHQLYMIKKLK
jgi:hypothetical protein